MLNNPERNRNQGEELLETPNYHAHAARNEVRRLETAQRPHGPERYAADFITQLHLDSEIEQKCEWTCLLWSKEHWANQAKKAQLNLQQTKERTLDSEDHAHEGLFLNAQFLNTVAQVYGRLFGFSKELCSVRAFDKCPYLGKRQELLETGALASVFATILHKGAMYAMLDRHPIDSGLMDEEYDNVYGVDLANFEDLQSSLKDGRFEVLYEAVVKRAKQLAGIAD